MWIRYKTFEELLTKQYEAVGRASALEVRLKEQAGTLEWLTFRLTQLEHERAQLIFNYMGVKIATPELESVPTRTVGEPKSGAELLNDIPTFDDVGDDEAKRLGLDWNHEGRVTQGGKVIS